ncbi:MAG TPA: aquaporin [Candidatus Lumbricidophila sp.]|nr:aquaporin [Candidatus Lumbricidophila sp.]
MILIRKAVAEFIGTALLVATVIGSGIMATNLTDDVGMQLLANSVITGGILVALILTLQPISAAFNPIVTAVDTLLSRGSWRDASCLALAQFAGGTLGAIVANLMFDHSAVSFATHERTGAGVWLGEVVATFGLVVVIFGAVRSGRTNTLAFAVAGYIVAAYWFTSSTSFANPAVTVARMFSDSFAGIQPMSVPMFVVMQVIGAAAAVVAIRLLFPHPAPSGVPIAQTSATTNRTDAS